MAEVLVRFVAEVIGEDGERYIPQACGGVADDGLWEGWIEFIGSRGAVRSGRETEQPNRDDLMYWAQGLSAAYLEGALKRATAPRIEISREQRLSPAFRAPAAPPPARPFRPSRAILNPFTTFEQGEDILRGQLGALSHDNLVAIVEDYQLPIHGIADIRSRSLVESIIDAVKELSAARESEAAADKSQANTDLSSGGPGNY
jgi:hypothetical protein